MQTIVSPKLSLSSLSYLPGFANYILNHKLKEYVLEQIRCFKELQVPILKRFDGFTDEQLFEYSLPLATEFLTCLAQNRAQDQIAQSQDRWKANQLSHLKNEAVSAEDITLVTYIRKQSFMHFISGFCNDTAQIISLVKEIDFFLAQSETASAQTYIDILRRSIEEQSHLNQKITNTSPGIIYLFNISTGSLSFANERAEEFTGIPAAQLIQKGNQALSEFIHPDDLAKTYTQLDTIRTAKEGEIRNFEYRLKSKTGEYIWMRNYISVFKWDDEGQPVEIIGNVQNIHAERTIALQLQQKEEQLKEAQEIAGLGSFEWNSTTKEGAFSDQFLRILDASAFGSLDAFLNQVHPDDRESVGNAFTEALAKKNTYEIEYRYSGKTSQKVLWSKGKVFNDEDGLKVKGTLIDITGRAAILEQLRTSEELYRQAQELSHIGHYSVDLKSNIITLTEELKRIYDLPVDKNEIKYQEIMKLRHPADAPLVEKAIKHTLATGHPFDITYRIHTKPGVLKTLHAIGKVIFDEAKKPVKMVGTVQDVTTYYQLLQKLQQGTSLYKQAEVLANMGNWSWDAATDKLEWSDQLYKIYGLKPQSEVITLDRFLSFVHPQDKPFIEQSIKEQYKENYLDYTFRIITPDGKEKTIRSIAQAQRDTNGELVSIIGSEQDVTGHQNLIEQLKQSENLYKQAQSLASVGNWSWDVKSNVIKWSDELYKIYGLEPQSEQLDFEKYLLFVHPDDKKMVTGYIETAQQTGEPWVFIHRIVWRDGSVHYLNSVGEVLKNTANEGYMMMGTAQDITQQKEYEKQLSEQQNFIQKIADATPSIIAAYNITTGKYVFINQGLYKLLGYNVQEALDQGISFFVNIMHPDDLEPMMIKNERALEIYNHPDNQGSDNIIIEFKYRMKHKNGTWRWFHTYGTIFDRDSKGRIEHVLNISLDITDRIDAEQRLAEQEHFIKHIADASPTILYLYDAAKNSIIYINREIFFVLGYSPEEIIASGPEAITAIYHPEDFLLLPERTGSGRHFQQQDSMIQYECRMQHKNGGWCWLLVREIPFKVDENGKVVQVLGAALDINRRKEMEKSLLNNSFQLEQSNASLEEFAYVASHDLKEPLRKISTFGDRLISTQLDNLTSDGRIYLKKIVEASQRMQTMISDLLSISLISGNKSFEPYSLQAILDDVMQTLEFKIEQKKAIIHADVLPEANIIPSQFRQLFQNLLSNSLKFIKEEVQPVIKITHQFVKPEEVTDYQLAKADTYHKLEFTDNGIGFENEFAGRIFAIFQRLHGRSEYEGTGIGLAICKKIIEHHGGVVYASGIPGKGANFTIILPL